MSLVISNEKRSGKDVSRASRIHFIDYVGRNALRVTVHVHDSPTLANGQDKQLRPSDILFKQSAITAKVFEAQNHHIHRIEDATALHPCDGRNEALIIPATQPSCGVTPTSAPGKASASAGLTS